MKRSNIEVLKQWLKSTPEGSQRIKQAYETKLQEQRRLAKTRKENNNY